jgi:TPR repeat protein
VLGNALVFTVVLLLNGAVFQVFAQQTESDQGQSHLRLDIDANQREKSSQELEGVKAKAEGGDADSEFDLGARYQWGVGVAKDLTEAVKWYRKAAEQNNAMAEANLAGCYSVGEGVAKDQEEAIRWYRKAADHNNAPAGIQSYLAKCYYNGEGVTKDRVEAVKWYRKAAEQNDGFAQYALSCCYYNGEGVTKNRVEAVKWLRKAADQNVAVAQYNLGLRYYNGEGITKDRVEAVKWYRKAVAQNEAGAQNDLGSCYYNGEGVTKDYADAINWFRKAAEQNFDLAQYNLGVVYYNGTGVTKDYAEAYKWYLLAAAQGSAPAKKQVAFLEGMMTREQIAHGQGLARSFSSREVSAEGSDSSSAGIAESRPKGSGTGFFITEDGYLITNQHVTGDAAQVRLLTAAGLISAKVVKVDRANDLALLKAEGKFAALAVTTSRAVRLGNLVATIGFPNIGLQGFAPKFARGEIGSLSGPEDDSRYFQISVPVQPGNSGGALVDERGNVVGIVCAKLSAQAAFAASGSLPENVNYAVKSSFLLGFLESVPEVAAKIREPNAEDMKAEGVAEQAKAAAVLVLVY